MWDPLYSLTCEDHILLFTDECEDQERSWQGPIREIGSTEPHPSTQNLVAHRSYCYGHASEKSQCPLCNIQLPRWRAGQRGSDRLPPTRRVPGAVPGAGVTAPRGGLAVATAAIDAGALQLDSVSIVGPERLPFAGCVHPITPTFVCQARQPKRPLARAVVQILPRDHAHHELICMKQEQNQELAANQNNSSR